MTIINKWVERFNQIQTTLTACKKGILSFFNLFRNCSKNIAKRFYILLHVFEVCIGFKSLNHLKRNCITKRKTTATSMGIPTYWHVRHEGLQHPQLSKLWHWRCSDWRVKETFSILLASESSKFNLLVIFFYLNVYRQLTII